jgi:hypothetical protein
MVASSIQTPQEFWENVVVHDYNDFMSRIDDLRLAFHCAISLFHMSDWIFQTHQTNILANIRFKDRKSGQSKPVTRASEFANFVSDAHPDFELIRQIANTAKHLRLTGVSPHPNAPSHAANTAVRGTGWGQGAWGQGPWGGTPRVMLANHPGKSDLEFSKIAHDAFAMWPVLRARHEW